MIDFYRCDLCGNVIMFLEKSGVVPYCCSRVMSKLLPGSTDGSVEKHVPSIMERDAEIIINIGVTDHPMTEEHYIQWIVLETNLGAHIKYLNSNDRPEAVFVLGPGEKLLNAYAFCNLHGLWMKKNE